MTTQSINRDSDHRPETTWQTQSGRLAGQWLLLAVVAAPLVALVAMIGNAAWQEWRASRQLAVLRASQVADKQPGTVHWLMTEIDRHRNDGPTERWQIAVAAAKHLEATGYDDPDSAPATEPSEPGEGLDSGEMDHGAPAGRWNPRERPDDAALQRFAVAATPLIDAVRDVTGDDQSIWSPFVFAGFGTLLVQVDDSRAVARCVSDAALGSHLAGRTDEAIDRWRLLPSVADTVDARTFFVGELIHASIRALQLDSIRRGLAQGEWSVEHLSLLRAEVERLQSADMTTRWQLAAQSEGTLALREINAGASGDRFRSPVGRLAAGSTASQRLAATRALTEPLSFLVDSGDHVPELRLEPRRPQSLPRPSLLSIPFANFLAPWSDGSWPAESLAQTRLRQVVDQRWTRCAIAIKQFRLQHGRWPTSLPELQQVGLSVADWEAWPGQSFGYWIAEDEQSVRLWSFTPSGGAPPVISSQPPSLDAPDQKNHLEIKLGV